MFTKKDLYYIDFVKNTKFLQENTKQIYLRRYEVIKTKVYKKPIEYILKHPQQFLKQLNKYSETTNGRVGNTNLGLHAKDGYISAMKALFIYNQELKERHNYLLEEWDTIQMTVRKPIEDKYKSNKPTIRQEAGFISYPDIINIRDSLKDGTIEKLLVTLYTEIPPVRSDFYKTEIIINNDSDTTNDNIKENIAKDINFIVINKLNKKLSMLYLQKYKTAKHYKTLEIPLTPEIVKQIELSLKNNPRSYLFVGKNNKPFDKENSFNTFANRMIKKIFNNQHISLCMFRHSYISRQDLKLEEKSGLEQDNIAKIMGHSISQQAKYRWNIWLKENEDV